jgi:hypothetical protein
MVSIDLTSAGFAAGGVGDGCAFWASNLVDRKQMNARISKQRISVVCFIEALFEFKVSDT